jgi:hypothetical protein
MSDPELHRGEVARLLEESLQTVDAAARRVPAPLTHANPDW